MNSSNSRFLTAVSLLLLLLTPAVLKAAEKLSALYSAQSVSYSLPWIAQDAGLFRKHNLDFQLVYIPSSGVATAALLGGDVEIALAGGVGTVRAFAQGATELVFIGGFKNALTHSIVAKPEMRMDEEFEKRGSREAPLLKAKPSEYMTNGQFYYAFELEESTLPYVAERVGSDKLLYSSDYPHWDTSWPNTVRTVRERQDITEAQKKQFLSDNVQRFYGFTANTSDSA